MIFYINLSISRKNVSIFLKNPVLPNLVWIYRPMSFVFIHHFNSNITYSNTILVIKLLFLFLFSVLCASYLLSFKKQLLTNHFTYYIIYYVNNGLMWAQYYPKINMHIFSAPFTSALQLQAFFTATVIRTSLFYHQPL